MGLVTKIISDDGSKGHHKFTLEVIEEKTTVSDNTSSLRFTFKLSPIYNAWDWYSWGKYISYSIKINGTEYTGYIPDYDGYATVTLKTGVLLVEHTADGSKTIDISFSVTDNAGQNFTPGNASASGKMELTIIPRQADITSASDFTDEQNPIIQYSNPAGDSVDTLQACISLSEDGEDIKYRDISKTGTSYTFNLTDEERNLLRNLTKNVKNASVYFIIKTVIGESEYYSIAEKVITIVNANPLFTVNNVSYKDINNETVAITEDNQKIVQNKSELQVIYTAAIALKGAEITDYKFILNEIIQNSADEGGSINFGTINSANNIELTVIVTDSRGNETTVTKNITILSHNNPNAIVTLQRLNNYEDETYLTVDASISSIDSKNTMSIQYRYKVSGGTYNSFVTIEDNEKQILSLDKNNMYIFNIVVTDALGARYDKEHALGKGVFPFFIDTVKSSVGINNFPNKEFSFEVFCQMLINSGEIKDNDLNNATNEGEYIIDGIYTNSPSIATILGKLIVKCNEQSSLVFQQLLLFNGSNGKILMRCKFENNWTNWVTIGGET